MSAYREDKLYLAGLVGWGVIIEMAHGWWRVGAIVFVALAILLHRVNERPASESVHEPGEGE